MKFNINLPQYHKHCMKLSSILNFITKNYESIVDSYDEIRKRWNDNLLDNTGKLLKEYSFRIETIHKSTSSKVNEMAVNCSNLAKYNNTPEYIVKNMYIKPFKLGDFKFMNNYGDIKTDVKAIAKFEEDLKKFVNESIKLTMEMIEEHKRVHNYWDDNNYLVFKNQLEKSLNEMFPLGKEIMKYRDQIEEKRHQLEKEEK